MSAAPYACCDRCGKEWFSRDAFLADEEIVLIGYQANFLVLEKGLFLFNHSCHNTLPVSVQSFADMYDGPIFGERLLETEACSGFCLHRNVLSPCPNQCECAYVRQILLRIGGSTFEDA